jgi:hypothetical protein
MLSHRHLNWISLSKLDTSFVFARTHSLPMGGARVEWIVECVRVEFECFEDDDIDLIEADDGREFVTINGKAVAEIHLCKLSGYVAGIEAREAA